MSPWRVMSWMGKGWARGAGNYDKFRAPDMSEVLVYNEGLTMDEAMQRAYDKWKARK